MCEDVRSQAGFGQPDVGFLRFSRMMGGDITVESEPGRGSTFTIRLPRIADVHVAAAARTGEAALKAH